MPLDVDALEQSFDLISSRGDQFVDRFYHHLFEAEPSIAALFERVDMSVQRSSLLATLVTLRRSLRESYLIAPELEQLGARHLAYGARPEHYQAFGSILIESMAEIGGADWRPEHTRAWSEVYSVVQAIMRRGAELAHHRPLPTR
jgi:methyl-accepting chemotaxis protein